MRTRFMSELVRADIPPQKCVCGYPFECCTPAPGGGTRPDAVPEAGSVTVCLKCARIYVFDVDLVVQPVRFEHLPIDLRAEVRRVVDAVHKVRRIPS